LLGAAGAVEAAFTLFALRNQQVPVNVNLESVCGSVAPIQLAKSGHHVGCDFEYALSNSFGFGGVNTSLVFRRFLGRVE
jgi:3-oxoacyl-[acyl-carrier-protein] synthase II